jgi:integron integrase
MNTVLAQPVSQPPRLLDRVRQACRVRHYSPRTEDCYADWIKRYILFHGKRHPTEMGAAEINAFLTDLAVNGHVSASTQNQAFSALLFLYQKVLEVDPGRIEGVIRALRPKRLPVVLSPDEVQRVISQSDGVYRLVALLQYGAGLRLLECLQLRIKDLDAGNNVIIVRHGKGGKDRRTMFPDAVKPALREHVRRVRARHERDLANGDGAAPLPDAFSGKSPAASRDFCWQFVFPASTIYIDPKTGQRVRWHSNNKLAEVPAMSLADFEAHINDESPGFRCYACGDRAEKATFVARVQNTVWQPANPRAIASLDKKLGQVGNQFKQFYAKHDGVLMYEDMLVPPSSAQVPRAAGVCFFPIAQWAATSREMRQSLIAMGWSKEDMTDWLAEGIAFAEIPASANFFVVQPKGKSSGKVYYADHDSFESDPIADSLDDFLGSILKDPADFLNRLGCYTRYSDGKTDVQWIPKEYVANVQLTNG